MEGQVKALQRQIAATQENSTKRVQDLEGKLQSRELADQRKEEFMTWANARPPMHKDAYAVVAKRAYELAALYPGRYGGAAGFKAAATDALSEFTTHAPMFAPKKPPRSLRNEGGGVAGSAAPDRSKLSLDAQISEYAKDIASSVVDGIEE
jgi:hypothetical protein